MNIRYPKFLRQRRDHRKPRRHIRRKVRVEMLEARQMLAADPASWIVEHGGGQSRLDVTDIGDVYIAMDTPDPDRDIVVKKFTTLGEESWASTFAGPAYSNLFAIDVDDSDAANPEIFIQGNFEDELDFGGAGTLQSDGEWDAFVAKLDAAGNAIWAMRFGGNGTESQGSVAVHGSSVYVTGHFQSNVDFGGTTLHASSSDGYILKLDKISGAVQWVQQISGGGGGSPRDLQVVESGGNVDIYVSGDITGLNDFGNTTLDGGSGQGFLAKLIDNGDSGSFVWAEQFGNASSPRLSVDGSGHVFVGGGLNGDGQFGDFMLTSNGWSGFVMRVTDNGSSADIDWVNQIASDDFALLRDVTFDDGTLFTATNFRGTAELRSTNGTSFLSSSGIEDIAYSRYDTNGNLLLSQQTSGSDIEYAETVVADNGILYASSGTDSVDAVYPATAPNAAYPDAFPNESSSRKRYLLKLNANAPIVDTSPAGPVVVSDGTPVTLTATAHTSDLGTDLGDNVNWTDESGATLGSGASIEVTLSPGTHRITASVVDPTSGLVGVDGTEVTVQDANQPIVLFSDSFEDGAWNGIWVEDSQGDWFTNSQRSTDGTSSAEVDGRATNAELTLATPIDMTSYESGELSFDWYIEGSVDGGEGLKLEFFDGSNWDEILSLDGNVDQEDVWHSEVVPLDAQYLISNFRFRYTATMNRSNEDANVDNVQLIATPTGPPNQLPTITSTEVVNATQDMAYSYDVEASDPDAGDVLTYSLEVSPGGMTIDSGTGVIDWTPNSGQVGLNSVTVRVQDQRAGSDAQTFTINVANVNDPPIATDDDYTTDQDAILDIVAAGVLGNDSDADGDGITVDSHTNPANGTVTVNSDGSFTYTPNPGYTGTDSFTYQASDGAALSNVATVTVTVSAPSTTIHVADLDGSTSLGSRGKWNAMVTITVRDAGGNPIANATVTGSWSNGASGTATCTTDSNGQCTVSKNNLKKNVNSITFTITGLVHATHVYDPFDNDDPDGDSDGTEITILKP